MKIKITEYFPGARAGRDSSITGEDTTEPDPFATSPTTDGQQHPAPSNILGSNDGSKSLPSIQPGSNGERYYTIQRVNGNGANGKECVSTGGHKHSMEDSNKVKKNSIERHFIKEEKERRKSQVSCSQSIAVTLGLGKASSSAMSLLCGHHLAFECRHCFFQMMFCRKLPYRHPCSSSFNPRVTACNYQSN